MNDPITFKVNVDKLLMMALEEDITSEDISTNCVMPEYRKGSVDLICKQDGVIAGLDGCGNRRYPSTFIRRAYRIELFTAHERNRYLYQ